MIEVLKDVLVASGDIDRYYEEPPVNLWRATKHGSGDTIFGLIEKEKILSNGKPRPTDITIIYRNGVKWVNCGPSPRGISTFDKPNTFGSSSWSYYKIPAGTKLPDGLAIVKDGFNSRLGATHYTIAPMYDMPLAHFKILLDGLIPLLIQEVA